MTKGSSKPKASGRSSKRTGGRNRNAAQAEARRVVKQRLQNLTARLSVIESFLDIATKVTEEE